MNLLMSSAPIDMIHTYVFSYDLFHCSCDCSEVFDFDLLPIHYYSLLKFFVEYK
jgi:hypothetical protein